MNRLFFQHEAELDHATRHLRRHVTDRAKRRARMDEWRTVEQRMDLFAPSGEHIAVSSFEACVWGLRIACQDPSWFVRNPVVDLSFDSPIVGVPVYVEARVVGTYATSPYAPHDEACVDVELEWVGLDDFQNRALRALVFAPRIGDEGDSPVEAFSFQDEAFQPTTQAPATDRGDGYWLWAGISP